MLLSLVDLVTFFLVEVSFYFLLVYVNNNYMKDIEVLGLYRLSWYHHVQPNLFVA